MAAVAAVCAVVGILVLPEAAVASFIYGSAFYRALLRIESGYVVLALMGIVAVLALCGFWLRGMLSPIRVDWLSVSVLLFVLWSAASLFWTPDQVLGRAQWASWVGACVVPAALVAVAFRKTDEKTVSRFLNSLLALGALFIVLSFFALPEAKRSVFERFAPANDVLAYARAMGFMLLFLIWMLDKSKPWQKLLILPMLVGNVYFLTLSATRAPFLVAMALAVFYLVFFSRTNAALKVVAVACVIASVIVFLPGSFMFLRISYIKRLPELSFVIRGIIWRSCLRHLGDVPPIRGVGMGGFSVFLPQMLKYIEHAHNNFAVAYTELGAVGLVLYIVTVFLLPVKAAKIYVENFRTRRPRIILLELGLLMWAYRIIISLINSPFADANYEWIGLGIMYSVLYRYDRPSFEGKKAPQGSLPSGVVS